MDALCLSLGQRLLDGLVDDLVIHGVLLRDGVGDQHTVLHAQLTLGVESSGQLLRGIQFIIHAEAGLAGVEGGQFVGAVADDRHALGLQILQRQTQIQNGLGTGAHHHHRGLAQLLQISGDVHGGLGATVYAADAAGGKDLNPGHVGDHHGGGNGAGAVAALGHQHRQITAAGLRHSVAGTAQIVDLLGGQTGLQAALDDGDGGRHSAVFTDELLHVHSGLHILGIGHTVGDDGALQRHHGLALLQSLFDLSGNVQITIQHDSVPPVDKFDLFRLKIYVVSKE